MLAVLLDLIEVPVMWILPAAVLVLILAGLVWITGLLVSLSETSE